MFMITLAEKGGGEQQLEFDKSEITIGRLAGNDIILAKGNVSKYHSRIVLKEGKLYLVDMKSTNGTYVNGKKIAAPQALRPSDKIYIGDYILNVETDGATAETETRGSREQQPPPETRSEARVPSSDKPFVETTQPFDDEPSLPPPPVEWPRDTRAAGLSQRLPPAAPKVAAPRSPPRDDDYNQLVKDLHERLIESLNLRRTDVGALGDDELWRRSEKAIREIILKTDLPSEVDRDALLNDVLNEALGLGPLEALLADDEVSEIMVNGPSQIYVERKGRLSLSDKTFSSGQAVLGAIERIVAPLGRRIDESSPLVDARLKDGSRVNAIIPPLALKGPCLTIRKFRREVLRIEDLVGTGTLTPQMAEFLEVSVKTRKNLVISGGTGSGKTTTLNILSSFIPASERIVTVEDAAELQLPQDHWVQLEARPSNLEGKGAITIRDLVRNCLRMRPDRIVVGECRGGETLDMLQAMNTGHDGSLTTLHANTPRDALARLETMVLMAGMDLPMRAIREQIASAVHLLIQQVRFADGTRRVSHITEVAGMESETVTLQDIFLFRQEGFSSDGKVLGRFVATGFVPKFYEELLRRGMPVNMSIFREEQ
ncbi:MAG: ATPase, T2SS/T4P/T4SS family [Myxococcaceae bacterium]